MKLFEYEAKTILAKYGIPVPKGGLAASSVEAREVAGSLKLPVVVKAQVLVAGRGKAGGILFVNSADEAEKAAEKLLETQVKGIVVKKILIEEKIPIKKQVVAICDMLGLDPFNIANEGKALISLDPTCADSVLKKIKSTKLGKDAEIIGDVKAENPKQVFLKTIVGGTRFVDMPLGEPIPRIC